MELWFFSLNFATGFMMKWIWSHSLSAFARCRSFFLLFQLTSIKPNNFALFWEDADKYRFALNSNADWEEALSYFSENKSTMNLKIYVTGVLHLPLVSPRNPRLWVAPFGVPCLVKAAYSLICASGISPDPPWVTGPSSQIQRVRRPSGQPTIASDIVHFAEGSLSEDMISPTSFASNHVLHPGLKFLSPAMLYGAV